MKQIYSIILILIYSVTVNGQKLQYKTVDKNFTWWTATAHQIDSFYYNLNPIQASNFQIHVRISLTRQIIDLFGNRENYNGTVTNIITEQGYNEHKPDKKVFEKRELDRDKVRFVINSLNSAGQFDLPTDSLIPNWNMNFLHCGSIYFDSKIDGQFRTQKYFCPWSQKDSVQYKSLVVKNYHLIKEAFALDSIYKEFEGKLPKGKTYSADGYRVMYIMTDKESENWKKSEPRRKYLESMKDTVDRLITAELKNQKIELADIDCFEDYDLVFGTNGKLEKVTVSEYDKPKLKKSLSRSDYRTDKKEVQKCKTKIMHLLGKIDLSFLNLKYELDRTLSFDNKSDFDLGDRTIY